MRPSPSEPAPLDLAGVDVSDVEALGLLALDRAEAGRLGLALQTLEAARRLHGPADALVEALIGLADAPQARRACPAGLALVERQIGWLEGLPIGALRTGLLLSVALLETVQRQPAWAAAWVKRAMAEDPGDPRPWDLLDLLLDADPKLPIDKKTKLQLKELRRAQAGPDAEDLAHPEDTLLVVHMDAEGLAWAEGEAGGPDAGDDDAGDDDAGDDDADDALDDEGDGSGSV